MSLCYIFETKASGACCFVCNVTNVTRKVTIVTICISPDVWVSKGVMRIMLANKELLECMAF